MATGVAAGEHVAQYNTPIRMWDDKVQVQITACKKVLFQNSLKLALGDPT